MIYECVSISQLEAEWKKKLKCLTIIHSSNIFRIKQNQNLNKIIHCLEAFAVDNARASLIELLLGDPHFLEGGEGSQDGASDPDGVFPLGRSDDLDLHGGRSQGGDLLLHTIGDTRVHGGATGEDGVGVKVLTEIDVRLHDGVEAALVDTNNLHTKEGRAEHGLGAAETLIANGDNLSIGQLVGLLHRGGGGGGGHLLLKVKSDVAKLLLDVADDLTLSGGDERVSSLSHDLHEVVSQITSGQVKTQDGVGESETFINGDGVRDTISDVEDETSSTARGVQGEHGLDAHVGGGSIEGLEDNLDELLPIRFGVEGSLRVEMRRFIGRDSQLIVEGVMPDLLHVVPGGDDTVLDGVFQRENTSLGLGLVTDVGVLVAHADHDGDVTGASNDGGEDGAGSVISGETALDHTGAIVNDQSSGILLVVAHGRCCGGG